MTGAEYDAIRKSFREKAIAIVRSHIGEPDIVYTCNDLLEEIIEELEREL